MSAIEWVVGSRGAQALGWALAHSVWQGAAVAASLAVALFLVRSARHRYATACAALGLMLLLFGFTFARSIPDGGGEYAAPTVLSVRRGLGDGAPEPRSGTPAAAYLPWLAPFWAAGVLVFHLRALAGWTASRRLRQVGVCAPIPAWTARLDELRSCVRVSRPVTLLESSLARVPVVVGHMRPVILMPAGLLAGLPTAQIEAVLLHELAHVRRSDYLVNVLQTWVEALFFYHPAAWWISRVLRDEREHCCDDLAVSIQGNPRQYAAALAALEQYRWSAEPAVAATGGNLVNRIRRLLIEPEGPRFSFAPLLAATVLTVVAAAALMAWQARPDAAQQAAELATPYQKWVNEDVAYIIDDRERAAFAALRSDAEREKFIEQFWLRRDPTPGTPANEMKEEHYRRIAYSNDRYQGAGIPGWKTDRGRVYIIYGPPDEIEAHPSGNAGNRGGPPAEAWLYRFIQGRGNNVIVRFEDPARTGEYRQTSDPRGR